MERWEHTPGWGRQALALVLWFVASSSALSGQSPFEPAEAPPEMSKLDFLIGTWRGEGEIYDAEGNVTRRVSTEELGFTTEIRPALNGQILELVGGGDFARTWYTYRPLAGEFVWVAVDAQSHFDHLVGNFDGGRLVLTEIGPQPWSDGGTMMFRRTYQAIEDDSHEVLMELSRDEGRSWILYSKQVEHRIGSP